MDQHEFTNPNNTVYKYDQVITEEDLRNWFFMLEAQYNRTPLILGEERAALEISMRVLDSLLNWILSGKHTDFDGLQ